MANSNSTKLYRLSKSRKILQESYECYKKKWKDLPTQELNIIEKDLEALDKAVLAGDRVQADTLARKLDQIPTLKCKKSAFEYTKELIIALVIALIVASLVRQMWFEPYEIPTGSMRPTFKEQDHLIVSKTTFGINEPLSTDHFYFDPNLVERTGIFIFSGDKLDMPDTDTTYFGIFPYKKRYIKRCLGKPGDRLYFYGGNIYGIDKEGNDISATLENQWMQKLDHVPFMSFEGRLANKPGDPLSNVVNEIRFLQMDLPVGRLSQMRNGELIGEIFDGTNWIKDDTIAQEKPHDSIKAYTDFFGMRNFAMARLLTRDQVEKYSNTKLSSLEDGILYLELRHNPSLNNPKPRYVRDELDNFSLSLTPFVSIIPLQQHHLDAIMNNMYTARFVVNNGRAHRYSVGPEYLTQYYPSFPGVSDGTYEFYYGKAYKIGWGGLESTLSEDDPLYSHDPKNIQRLFNVGIDMLSFFEPHSPNQVHFPTRYAYFREGTLYLLGAPILEKNDQALISFVKQEEEREKKASTTAPYVAFKDFGPPIKDGQIDKDFIKTFGVTIPDKHYLALGDNYAMSADSRYFGFVPEANIQGSPSIILWPLGPRWGLPNQKPYPWFTLPTIIVWSIVALILLTWYVIYKRNLRKPVFKRVSIEE